jgi:polyisoprenoid-binding protein YceI
MCQQRPLHQKIMKILLSYLLFVLLLPDSVREMRVNSSKTQLTIYGTSSIHDWEIEAKNCSGIATVVFQNESVSSIDRLSFKVAVASLESGKSAMDANTVEALKGDEYPFITYELVEIKAIKKEGEKTFINAIGTLSIAGASRRVNMEIITEGNEASLVISGEVKLKMTDFKVDPPTAIFGTITTGDAITIKFKTNYIH